MCNTRSSTTSVTTKTVYGRWFRFSSSVLYAHVVLFQFFSFLSFLPRKAHYGDTLTQNCSLMADYNITRAEGFLAENHPKSNQSVHMNNMVSPSWYFQFNLYNSIARHSVNWRYVCHMASNFQVDALYDGHWWSLQYGARIQNWLHLFVV